MMSLTVLILLASIASLCHCFKFYIPRSLANLNGANIRGSSLGSLVSPLALRRLSTTIVDREREARTVPTVKKCRLWNDEMDAALIRAIRDDKGAEWEDVPQWVAVAVRMQRQGFQVSDEQCANRWSSHLRIKAKGLREGVKNWTDAEVDQLCAMREQGMRWCDIGAKLNYSSITCSRKWKAAYVQRYWASKRELLRNSVDDMKKDNPDKHASVISNVGAQCPATHFTFIRAN